MPHYNEICHWKYKAKKTTTKKAKTKISWQISYLILKAPINNVKLQSDKTLTTQIYFFLTAQQTGFSLMRPGNKSKKRKNEAKFKNIQNFLDPLITKVWKIFSF